MKWCRFTAGGETSFGLIEGESVRRASAAPWTPHTLGTQSFALKDVKLELPVIPATFFCVGVNYKDPRQQCADRA